MQRYERERERERERQTTLRARHADLVREAVDTPTRILEELVEVRELGEDTHDLEVHHEDVHREMHRLACPCPIALRAQRTRRGWGQGD
eukprot:COSAG03_NODE_8661_length_782_cov_1.207906_2_plen_88_part_01